MADTRDSDALPAETGPIPGLPADWPQQATERVVGLVDNVRTKTSGPAIKISRAVVYGLVAAILALIALPLFLIGATRGVIEIFDNFLSYDKAVWTTYYVIGGLLLAGGALLWRKRPRGAAEPRTAS